MRNNDEKLRKERSQILEEIRNKNSRDITKDKDLFQKV